MADRAENVTSWDAQLSDLASRRAPVQPPPIPACFHLEDMVFLSNETDSPPVFAIHNPPLPRRERGNNNLKEEVTRKNHLPKARRTTGGRQVKVLRQQKTEGLTDEGLQIVEQEQDARDIRDSELKPSFALGETEDQLPDVSRYQAKHSFSSWDEFKMVNCIAPFEQYEAEWRQVTGYEQKTHNAFFCEILGGADRVYLALIDMPAEEQIRLQPGSAVTIYDANHEIIEDFYVDDRDGGHGFGKPQGAHATVAEPIPGLPRCLLPLYMSRRWDKEAQTFIGWDNLNIIQIQHQDELLTNIAKLREKGPTPVVIRIRVDTSQYDCRVFGMKKLIESLEHCEEGSPAHSLKRLLVGNDVAMIDSHDLFADILESIPDPESVMRQMNEGQKAVVKLARDAPAGFINVHGPPGTGKTHVCGEMGRPFLVANQPNAHILATSASNVSTDALAARFHSMIVESGKPGQYCIRIHSASTESDIVRQKAKLKQAIPDDAKPRLMQEIEEDQKDLFESIHFASVIHEGYKRQHSSIEPFIPDHRVTELSLELSVGRRVLQLMGEHPAGIGDPTPDPENTAELQRLYIQYKNNVEFSDTMETKFKKLLIAAHKRVLAEAVVVCATPGHAIQPKLCDAISDVTQMVIIDEASRIHECDVMAILGCYPCANGVVMVGDPLQLPPPVMFDGRFDDQMKRSFQTRLLGNGTVSAFLSEQYRMAPHISAPLSTIAYQDRLIDHVSVGEQNRPMLAAIREFNEGKFGVSKYCLLYDIQNSETIVVQGTHSRYNPKMAQFCVNLAIGFLKQFPEMSIAIICFYNAQYLLYLAMRDRMIIKDSAFSRLCVIKADSVQGLEFDCTIVDLTIGETAGFLGLLNRLVVAISRAKLSTNLVIDKAAVCRAKSAPVKRVCSEYFKIAGRIKVNEETGLAGMCNSEFYRPG